MTMIKIFLASSEELEEELVELFEGRLWELPRIEDFLHKYHLRLYLSDRRTYKLSYPKK